jgi:glutaredoxin 3
MSAKRKIEIFSAGCPACDETIKLVNDNACPSCEVEILDVKDDSVQSKMKSLGIKSIPAVAIDGKLADCCAGRGPDLDKLKAAGLGQS